MTSTFLSTLEEGDEAAMTLLGSTATFFVQLETLLSTWKHAAGTHGGSSDRI